MTHIRKQKKQKWDQKWAEKLFIENIKESKGYKVLDVKTNKVITARLVARGLSCNSQKFTTQKLTHEWCDTAH